MPAGARLLELVQRELPTATLGLDRRLEAEVQLPGQDMRRFAKVLRSHRAAPRSSRAPSAYPATLRALVAALRYN